MVLLSHPCTGNPNRRVNTITDFQPCNVEGSCGHTFTVDVTTPITCPMMPEYIEKLMSGDICRGECPVCSEQVIFYAGIVLNTYCERIGVFPLIWEDRILKEVPDVDTMIFEEYGGPFVNLKKHMQKLGLLTEEGELSEQYLEKIRTGAKPEW